MAHPASNGDSLESLAPAEGWPARLSQTVALSLLVFLTATGVVGSVGLLAGIPITRAHLWMALGLTGYITYRALGRDGRMTLLALAVSTALTLVALLLSSFFTDYGNDVYGYHTPIVLALDRGWNPVYTPLLSDWDPAFAAEAWLPWVDVHAKFHCVGFAVIYQYVRDTSVFEHTHVLMILVSLVVSYRALGDIARLRRSFRFMGALLLAMNPIALLHWQSGYIDGLLASLLTVLVMALAAFVRSGKRAYLPFVVCAFIVAGGIKLSGPILIVLLAGIVLGAAWLCGLRAHLRPAILATLLAAGISAACFVNPLITNTLEFGSPLYPFVTFGDTAAMPPAESPYPEATNRFVRFVWAHLIGYDPWNAARPYQIPLIHYDYLSTYNHNLGGFGPLFGAVFCVACILLLFCRKERFLLLIAAGILATAFLQPYVERARYIPQVWLYCMLALMAFLSGQKDQRRALAAGAVAMLAFLNATAVFTSYLKTQWKETTTFYEGLAQLKQFGGTVHREGAMHTVATQRAIYDRLGCAFDVTPLGKNAKRLHRFATYRLGPAGHDSFESFVARYRESDIVLYATAATVKVLPAPVLDWLGMAGATVPVARGEAGFLAVVRGAALQGQAAVPGPYFRQRFGALDLFVNTHPIQGAALEIDGHPLFLRDADFHLIAHTPEGLVHLAIYPKYFAESRPVTTFVPVDGIFGTFFRHQLLTTPAAVQPPAAGGASTTP